MTSRQVMRRSARKSQKRLMARAAREATAATLASFRATRDPATLPARVPGKLLPAGRMFRKPHGRAAWRTRSIKTTLFGLPFVAEFHNTKGFRRWDLAA